MRFSGLRRDAPVRLLRTAVQLTAWACVIAAPAAAVDRTADKIVQEGTRTARLTMAYMRDDEEMDALRDCRMWIAVDSQILKPVTAHGQDMEYQHRGGRQLLIMKCSNYVAVWEPSVDFLQGGIVVLSVFNDPDKALRQDWRLPAPLEFGTRYDILSAHAHSRHVLRGQWLALPDAVRRAARRVQALTFVPRDGSRMLAYQCGIQ